MITLRNVEKFYEGGYGRTFVLHRINLEIRDGEFVTIMGPSGAGKSTLLNIVGKRDLYPSQLSGGQQQLVAVARAVIANPKLILADEPTGNLHSSQGKEIMELFKKLNEEGVTIIQVTHSEVNAAYGDRIIQLVDGWVSGDTAKREVAGATR